MAVPLRRSWQPTIEDLVYDARGGSRWALHALYVRYAPTVQRQALFVLRDPGEAEDVTHEVFEKLPRKLALYEPEGGTFRGWLLRVARNAALDHLRRRRSVPCGVVPHSDANGEESWTGSAEGIKEALRGLPPDQREVLVLRHFLGLSPGEVAERLGKTASSVHALHHRGRRAVRVALSELELTPTTRSRPH